MSTFDSRVLGSVLPGDDRPGAMRLTRQASRDAPAGSDPFQQHIFRTGISSLAEEEAKCESSAICVRSELIASFARVRGVDVWSGSE